MWEFVASMNDVRAGASVSAVDGLLYVIGGRRSYSDVTLAPTTHSSAECFDPRSGQWSYMKSMPTGRCETGVALI